MRYILLSVLLGAAIRAAAQFSDDFSQYTTAEIPNFWAGNTSHFIINSQKQLQLKAPAAGSSMLVHKSALPDSIRFIVDFRLDFAPSPSNQLRIFLLADNDNLLIANGYFIEIGETGNKDAIRFFRQHNGQATLLATGRAGVVATEPVVITLEIDLRSGGRWSCRTRTQSGWVESQFQLVDAFFAPRKFRFGLWCKYTATRREAFYFDKIVAETYFPDVVPPQLLSVEALSDSSLRVVASEPLASSCLTTGNFTILNWTNHISARFEGQNPAVLHLQWAEKILPNRHYLLRINQLEDVAGNITQQVERQFYYQPVFLPRRYDVIINEIMADPTPAMGLPEVEWVEIYNRSPRALTLDKCTFGDAASPAVSVLPAVVLLPDELLVLLPAGQVSLPIHNGKGVQLSPFPVLNNDTDEVWLKNADGTVIDRVQYHIHWHTEAHKMAGGWSLERRNPLQPCLEGENWGSCNHLSGGTPGAVNSLDLRHDDESPPRLLYYFVENARHISLQFSEGINTDVPLHTNLVTIAPPLKIDTIAVNAWYPSIVDIFLADSLLPGRWYDVIVDNKLTDCAANPPEKPLKLSVALPQKPENQDVVISEIMFDPPPGGARYIEIYNRSDKMLDTQHLLAAHFSGNSPAASVRWKRLFPPKTFLVLTPDTAWVARHFEHVLPERLLPVSLPNFNVKSGNVALLWVYQQHAIVLDSFHYSQDMHNALLSIQQREGVALEKIRIDFPNPMPSNWTSARQNHPYGAGTPTQPNSQSKDHAPTGEKYISLSVNTLSPNGDGRDDFLEIIYQLPQTGFAANFNIFNADGTLIRRLKRQELMGTSGLVRWDGAADDGSIAKPGIYILWAELFHPSGQVEHQKLTFSIMF